MFWYNRASGMLRNLIVSNTNQFSVQNVDFDLLLLKYTMKLYFPVLSLKTNFENIVGRWSYNCQVNGNGNAAVDFYGKSSLYHFLLLH